MCSLWKPVDFRTCKNVKHVDFRTCKNVKHVDFKNASYTGYLIVYLI